MADLALNFRIGSAKGSTKPSDPAFVAARAAEFLRKKAEAKGVEQVFEAILASEERIVAEVTKDANAFASAAAKVFTRVKSPGGGAITISLDDVMANRAVSSSDSFSKRLQGRTTIEWIALTQQTLKNKRQRMRARSRAGGTRRAAGDPTTFFVDSGELRKLLVDYLGPAMASMLDPKIRVRRGAKKVTCTISLLTQASGKEKAGVSRASLPGVVGGGIAREESLFVRYLKKVGAPDRDPKHPLRYKLENPLGAHRSFLQNMLIYWISNRLPLVLERSLKDALKTSRRKKAK